MNKNEIINHVSRVASEKYEKQLGEKNYGVAVIEALNECEASDNILLWSEIYLQLCSRAS